MADPPIRGIMVPHLTGLSPGRRSSIFSAICASKAGVLILGMNHAFGWLVQFWLRFLNPALRVPTLGTVWHTGLFVMQEYREEHRVGAQLLLVHWHEVWSGVTSTWWHQCHCLMWSTSLLYYRQCSWKEKKKKKSRVGKFLSISNIRRESTGIVWLKNED